VRGGPGEDVPPPPAFEDALVELGECLLRVDRAELRHERRILAAAPRASSRARPDSVRERDRAVLGDAPARVVRDLPRVTFGIDEDGRVPAPEGLGGLPPDRGAGGASLLDPLVALLRRTGVVRGGAPPPPP